MGTLYNPIRILPKIWDQLPESVQSGIYGTRLHRFLQRQVVYREPLDELEIKPTDEFSFKIVAPKRFDQHWFDYDPEIKHSCHEPLTTRTFINEVSPGDVVWDIGSQWGYFSILAANLNRSPSDVHLFDSKAYHCLRIERTSEVLFGDDGLNINETLISDTPDKNQMTGDQYRAKTGPPDLIKVDIEGAEVAAVAGMEKIIKKDNPLLIIEIHPNKVIQKFDADVAEFLSYLKDQYDIMKISHNYRKVDSDWDDFKLNNIPSLNGEGVEGATDWDSYRDTYQVFCK